MTLLLVLACNGAGDDTSTPTTTRTDTDDTGGPPAQARLDLGAYSPDTVAHPIDWGCGKTAWDYTFHTVGVAGRAELHKVETNERIEDPTDETHPVPVVASDSDGWWSRLELYLTVDEASTWVAGATTNAECDNEDLEGMDVSWHLVLLDAAGERVDCAVWGADPMWFEDSDCYIW